MHIWKITIEYVWKQTYSLHKYKEYVNEIILTDKKDLLLVNDKLLKEKIDIKNVIHIEYVGIAKQ